VQQPHQSVSPTPSASSATPGQGTVTMDKQHYSAADPITATLTNGLVASIWAADHQTSCSVLTVEMQQGDRWLPVGQCRSMITTRMVPFAAGSQTTVQLLGAGTDPQNVWPAGTYRARFSYRGSESAVVGPTGTVYSAQFTIG
jgi:hypothetical protein